MEMTYDGALVMPKNFAVVDEEEMTYVEGGFRIPRVAAAIVLDIGALAFAPYLAPMKFMGKEAAKFLVKRYLPKLTGVALKAARTLLGITINAVNGAIGTWLLGYGWALTSVGNLLALVGDALDGNVDGWIGR